MPRALVYGRRQWWWGIARVAAAACSRPGKHKLGLLAGSTAALTREPVDIQAPFNEREWLIACRESRGESGARSGRRSRLSSLGG